MKTHPKQLRVGLVMPHIFMHPDILDRVIFAPGHLALDLANGLSKQNIAVSFFTPGPMIGDFNNIHADLRLFEAELAARGDSYLDLLKKHPFTFITLARQVQSEIIAAAYSSANNGELDVVHIYGNEEDTALPFAQFCKVPVVFTHHDPFNFLVKYRSIFPKYQHLNWLSLSYSQRQSMPETTNWVGNVYHGIDGKRFTPNYQPSGEYMAYMGRIIEPKGVHLAIKAAKKANFKLKIAGKHYSDNAKDSYWQQKIVPHLNKNVEYLGYLKTDRDKQDFLGNASALIIPSTFAEPFGMVMIEALACGTPLIGLNSGAISEVIKDNKTGFIAEKGTAEIDTINNLVYAMKNISKIKRKTCYHDFTARFSAKKMALAHKKVYKKLIHITKNTSISKPHPLCPYEP